MYARLGLESGTITASQMEVIHQGYYTPFHGVRLYFSSKIENYSPGWYYNSQSAWIRFMFGYNYTITGVLIQGAGYNVYYWKTYYVKYSPDGITYQTYNNKDGTQKVKVIVF